MFVDVGMKLRMGAVSFARLPMPWTRLRFAVAETASASRSPAARF